MRRKSERNKSKSGSEKKTTDTTPKKTRRTSRRRRRSTSHSSSEDSDDVPLKPAVVETQVAEVSPPSDEPKVSGSRSNSDEDKQEEQPIWKVKTTEAPSGEIQKLKICLQRPPTTPERTEKSPRRRRGKASSQSDDASLTPEEKPHKRKTRRSSPVSQVAEGSSMDNSVIEDAEKDECIIIVKETNEVMLGKGKLDSSQPSQDSENEECTQDSQTKVQADESVIKSKIKQDMEQDSAPVIKDEPQKIDAKKTVDPQETVIETPDVKQMEVTEEKLVKLKSEKESQIIEDTDNQPMAAKEIIESEKSAQISTQEKQESNFIEQKIKVEQQENKIEHETKKEIAIESSNLEITKDKTDSNKQQIKTEVTNAIKQANDPVSEGSKQSEANPEIEVTKEKVEHVTKVTESVPTPTEESLIEVNESVSKPEAKPVTEVTKSVPKPKTEHEELTVSVLKPKTEQEELTVSVLKPKTEQEELTVSVLKSKTEQEELTESVLKPKTEQEELTESIQEPKAEVTASVAEPKAEVTASVAEPKEEVIKFVPESKAEPVTEDIPALKAEEVTKVTDSVPKLEAELVTDDTESVRKPEVEVIEVTEPEAEVTASVAEPKAEVIEFVPEPKAEPEIKVIESVPETKVIESVPETKVIESVPETKVIESVPETKAELITEENDSVPELQKSVKKINASVPELEVVTKPEPQEDSVKENSEIISSKVNSEETKISEELQLETNSPENSTNEIETSKTEVKSEVHDEDSSNEEDKSPSNEEEKSLSNPEEKETESSVEDNKSTSDVKDVSPEKEQDSKPASPETKISSNEEKMEEDSPERIPRKRNWGKYSARLTEDPPITLNVIRLLFPSFKMLDVEDVILEIEEPVREPKITKKEREITVLPPVSPKEDDFEKEVSNIGLNRKISIVNDEASKLQPPPSPAKNPVSSILYITNLVRPFTIKQLQELLSRTGKIVADGFWTDKIKSKCYVQYETDEEADATRNALHGVQWPTGNGKKLIIDFGTTESMAVARNAVELIAPKPAPEKVVEKVPENKKEEPKTEDDRWEKTRAAAPIREWDLGKIPQDQRDRSRSRDRNQSRLDRDRTDKKRQLRNESPSNGDHVLSRKKKKEDAEVKMMDDLFHKTKATPSIYWLPLSPDQIAKKQQERLQRMAEHKRRMEESRRLERNFGGRGAPRSRRRSTRYDGD